MMYRADYSTSERRVFRVAIEVQSWCDYLVYKGQETWADTQTKAQLNVDQSTCDSTCSPCALLLIVSQEKKRDVLRRCTALHELLVRSKEQHCAD